MRFYRLIFHHFDLCGSVNFGTCHAIFPLGFEVVKETKEQQLERIKSAWAPWKAKLVDERNQRNCRKKIRFEKKRRELTHINPQDLLNRGGSKGDMKQLLRRFWESWESLNTDQNRLAELIKLANKFTAHRLKPKKLRKARAKYERHRYSLLTIPDCKCGTCDNPSKIRHHIIPLCFGGPNSPLNLILLCNSCHEGIHPWMKR